MALSWRHRAGLAAGLLAAAAMLAGAVRGLPQPQPLPTATPSLQALQALIDATPAGGTLRLAAGRYRGPVRIDRPLVLEGGGRARIEGDGHGSVLSVAADGVTLRGLVLSGSGDSQDRMDAGLQLAGSGHRVEDNEIDDVLFGIHLAGVSRSVVRGNRVRGKALETGLRGDALRLWNSRDNRIEDNRFERGRDLTLINSPDNQLRRNRFEDGRYGLHAVFSPRLLLEGNQLVHTGTGIVVLYSPQPRLLRNHIAHALTDGGAGILIKESDDSLVDGNEILHCGVGLKLGVPIAGAGGPTVRGNHFAHNLVGLSFYGEAGSGLFADNRFSNNLQTVAISAPGVGAGFDWQANDWDEYQGFDRDGDRHGDTPHEVQLFADRIWMELPMAGFFRNSPALELLDFLERLAPFSTPVRVLSDPRPRMGARVPNAFQETLS